MEKIQKIKFLCEKYGIRPSKKYGQNFLVDERVPKKMCEAAQLNSGDFVVEVGPGLGMLTREIARRAKKVLAVEVDVKMFAAAKEILAPYRNVEVLHEDILKILNSKLTEMLFGHPERSEEPALSLPKGSRAFANGILHSAGAPFRMTNGKNFKVVASLPYSITSAALRKFTESVPRPTVCVFLVQKEVAQRVCAKPGEMSVLSVAVQFYGAPEIVAVVKRGAFWPVPEVDSAVLRIKNYELGIRNVNEQRLFQIVRIGFSSRRKQLQNNLMAGLHLPREVVLKSLKSAGLSERIRAQELGVKEWIKLVEAIFNDQVSRN